MTPTIALLAICIIAAGLCVAVGWQQFRMGAYIADLDRERARHEVTNELLTEARNEAKNEYDLRRQAEKNLKEANVTTDKLQREAEHLNFVIGSWKDSYESALNRASRFESALAKYSRPRDPKTGRFVSVDPDDFKGFDADTFNNPDRAHAAFDAMMGNAIEQLQGLTVRKLCDEIKHNASSVI